MVSIIVPVYNIKEYLPVCVESLLGQTEPDLEILLVDDGSSDGSGDLCDGYARRDPRVRVIHKKNGGLSSARNAGLDAASGEWILLVDGDDYLAKNAVERLLSVATVHKDADFVQFLYAETDGSWQPEAQRLEQTVVTAVPDLFRQLYRLGGVAASCCTKLFRRSLFDSLRFKEGIRQEDEELMTRLLPVCRKAVYTNLVLYGYVMRRGSIIHSGFSPRSMDVFGVMEERIPVLERFGCEDLVRETRRRMFMTALGQYCLARAGGHRREAAELKNRVLALTGTDLALAGKERIVHALAGRCHLTVDLYYWARRLFGKM